MQIGKVLFPITSLGPGERIGIWTTGCYRSCPGCSNPELQLFDDDKEIGVDSLYDAVKDMEYTGVTVSGGEPFLQKDLRHLIERFREEGIDDILIFTGFTIGELRERHDADIDYILSNISVLVDGPFIKEKHVDNPLKGSSNQNIIVLDKKFERTYAEYISEGHDTNIFNFNNEVHFIGIPKENYRREYLSLLERHRHE